MLNVYVLEREDDWKYDEYIEQTIVAETEDRAIKLASKEVGVWVIKQKADLFKEQILTKNFNAG